MTEPAARGAAFRVLRRYRTGAIERVGPELERQAPADDRERALCRELVLGVLRNDRLYDAVVRGFLHRPGRQPEELLIALLLAAHQLFGMERIPAHAVGASTGELLREAGADRLVGVANAVVRRLVAIRTGGIGDPWERLPEAFLPDDPAVRYSLPQALLEDLGPGADLAALVRRPYLGTRVRPGRSVPELPGQVRREGEFVWWDDPAAALRGPVAEGAAVVQDRAQYELLRCADPRPGERVLDLCAAPGGKTRHLLDSGCRVVAADIAPERAGILRDAVGCPVLVQDGRLPALTGGFDLVLVDAPCSNSGVLARRPEAKRRYRPELLESLCALQDALLLTAAGQAAPGGRIAYTTCSVVERENGDRVRSLADWRVVSEHRCWPDRWRAGGYAAVLRPST